MATQESHPRPQELLVDVRSADEFATGYLSNDEIFAGGTVNIEYPLIDQLPQVYSARGITVDKNDNVTLYCRSGRRSNIALGTLTRLGYQNVRDIGGLEEARATLKKESMERLLELDEQIENKGHNAVDVVKGKGDGEKKHARTQSFGALLDGLKALED